MAKAKKKNAKGAPQSKQFSTDWFRDQGSVFWAERRKAFRKSNRGEYQPLRGRWHSITNTYELLGSDQAQNRFKLLGEGAALGLSNPKNIEPWKRWFAELIHWKVNYNEVPKTFSYPQKFLDNPRHPLRPGDLLPVGKGRKMKGTTNRIFGGKTVTIDRVFEASAVLCDRLTVGRSGCPTEPLARQPASTPSAVSAALKPHAPTESSTTGRKRKITALTDVAADLKFAREKKQRGKRRSSWLNEQMEDKEWTSFLDVKTASGLAYNTINRWASGQASTRDPYVKRELAKAFEVSIRTVPA